MNLTQEIVEEALGRPIDDFAQNCHAASIALVKSGLLGKSRVARGSCRGVLGQHSWAVVGEDCYDGEAAIVDITLWSYDETKPKVWVGTLEDDLHRPHFGSGDIWAFGCPAAGGGEEIELTPSSPLSSRAQFWVDMFRREAGALDRRFWGSLMTHAPYWGWPSSEITLAVYETDALRALIPIDRVGMQTNVNPSGLYLPGEERE